MSLVFAISAWALVLWGVLNISRTFSKGVSTVQRLHQIPCSKCQYFTNNYALKCTVHPHVALSETAIDCLDYDPYQ